MTAVVRQLAECAEDSLGPGASLRSRLDPDHGCPRLVQRQLRFEPEVQLESLVSGAGELWYVTEGAGILRLGDETIELVPRTALLLRPGTWEVRSAGTTPLEIIVVVLPDGTGKPPDRSIEAHLEQCAVETTGDREFRVLIGHPQGCTAATQFVGHIPPGRAPFHEHTYDEVVMVLAGRGVVHLDHGSWAIERGTSIYLPPGTKHCLENDGDVPLQVLGVFHPGGTPAAKKEHVSG